MNEAQKEAVRKLLTARKLKLEEELQEVYQERFADDSIQDTGDQALSSTMESLKSSYQDTKLGEYRRIKRALEMIQDGTYGVCIDCDEDITGKRLKLFPDATRCLACQETFEEQPK